MSKVMSILEKYNFVEKVNKEEPENTNLNEENNINKVEANEYIEEEIKKPEPAIKEENFAAEPDIEYEKKITINDIYSLYGIECNNINTVFMLQNLINALPQNLPKDVVRQAVINIIGASNVELNKLLSDGEQRLEVLAKVMDGYYIQTNKLIAEYNEEISKLSNLINNCKEQIKIKEGMLEDQTYLIKYESQKIEHIIDFFSK